MSARIWPIACAAEGAMSQGRERQRARNTLVVVQVALALVLLIGSGLMIRTFQACETSSRIHANPRRCNAAYFDSKNSREGRAAVMRMQTGHDAKSWRHPRSFIGAAVDRASDGQSAMEGCNIREG